MSSLILSSYDEDSVDVPLTGKRLIQHSRGNERGFGKIKKLRFRITQGYERTNKIL